MAEKQSVGSGIAPFSWLRGGLDPCSSPSMVEWQVSGTARGVVNSRSWGAFLPFRCQ